MMNQERQKLWIAIVLSLTLGLAPFFPEPHLVGKIRWVFGGANGMQSMDYFDLILHGSPWLYLVYAVVRKVFEAKGQNDTAN
ncbi:hypothetical protein [Marinoscillum sp. MHG1-6]|uniref:hypothetical protein n=1 Tax=Marinoscillum sp. MHG1-6 TaxID=2959627 RepID=UPI002157F8BD|nr:hypothetical protein [Marinoscillum sp. MHG1-6]